MVNYQLRCVKSGPGSYNYYAIDAAAAEYFFGNLKKFWLERKDQQEAYVRDRVVEYRETTFRPGTRNLQTKIADLYLARESRQPFSMIDFGGASGSIFYFLKRRFEPGTVRYLLIEPFKPFVRDFLDRNPGQKGIIADAEKFVTMDNEAFVDAPYDVFFASLVMCMIKPQVVREALKKAATLTDQMIFWDCLENAHGQLARDDPVIFDYFAEGGQWYFAHNFERYLADVGFELISVEPTVGTGTGMKQGWATMHARRRKAVKRGKEVKRAKGRKRKARK